MNRRSFVRWLGLAPVAAPAALAASAQASACSGSITVSEYCSGFSLSPLPHKATAFTFDGQTLTLPSLQINTAQITSEVSARVSADEALASRIDSAFASPPCDLALGERRLRS